MEKIRLVKEGWQLGQPKCQLGVGSADISIEREVNLSMSYCLWIGSTKFQARLYKIVFFADFIAKHCPFDI